jgi:hypothetical protein
MLAVQQLIYLVNGQDVGHMTHLVLVTREVNIELIVIIVTHHFENCLIHPFLLHQTTHHVAVYKLINLLHGHVHPVIGRYMSFQFEKISANIVHINETKLLMNVMLGDVDVVVVVAVLIKAGNLTARPNVTCHRVGDDCATGRKVFSNNLCQGWVLSVWDVIKQWDVGRAAKHTEYTINLACKNRAF